MSESELKATEKISESLATISPQATEDTNVTVNAEPKKRTCTLTEAKKAQLQKAREKANEVRKQKAIQKNAEKESATMEKKQSEIKSWIHNICDEYINGKYQPEPTPHHEKAAKQKVIPSVPRNKPQYDPIIYTPPITKEDYFLSIIRNR